MKYGDKLITIMKAIWTESIADKIIKKNTHKENRSSSLNYSTYFTNTIILFLGYKDNNKL